MNHQDDRDFSWMGTPAPTPVEPVDHFLWALEKRTHRVECRVRATPMGPEIRIVIDGELWLSHVYKGATTAVLEDAAERRREEFEAKGWTRPGPQEVRP